MGNRKLFIKTWLLLFLLFYNASGYSQDRGSAIVRILVNSTYDNSEFSLDQIRNLGSILPPTKVELDQGQTLSDIFLDKYRIGSKELLNINDYLINETLKLNGYNDPRSVVSGELLIPTIAPKAFTNPNKENTNHILPRRVEYGFNQDGTLERISFDSFRRQGAPQTYIEIEIPLETLDSLDQNLLEVEGFERIIESADLDFRFEFDAEAIISENNSFLDIDLEKLQSLIDNQKIKRKTYLFILDSGWPSEKVYNESIKIFENTMDGIWSQLDLPSPKRDFPSFIEPSCKHVQLIEKSLNPFTSIKNDDSIQILYLPLSKEQGGEIVLKELMLYHEIISHHRSQNQFLALDNPLKRRELNRMKKNVDNLLKKIPDKIGKDCSAENIRTNYKIIYGLQNLAEKVSIDQNTSYFINFSWNPIPGTIYLQSTEDDRGMFVVAAGNTPRDVIESKIPFGSLINKRGDVVVAVNVNKRNYSRNCRSASVKIPKQISLLKGIPLGFHGDLSSTHCGGTSFASPRIAWILALGESIRSDYSSDVYIRRNIESDILKTINIELENHFEAIWFDPLKYLTKINDHED